METQEIGPIWLSMGCHESFLTYNESLNVSAKKDGLTPTASGLTKGDSAK